VTEPAPDQPPAAPPQTVPPPAAAPAPQQQAAPATDEAGLTAAEETELGGLLGKRDAHLADAGAIALRVEPPHTSISYGGLTVGTEFTTVPAVLVAAITEAAADAGVTITQES
jgi:hypothetical protein